MVKVHLVIMADSKIANDSLLEYFTCPICFAYMNNKIYICTNGHSVCGRCQPKISKCPICMIKLDSKRNITLEKAAKKFQELKVKQDALATREHFVSVTRKQRFSLSTDLTNRTEERIFFEKNHVESNIQCPISKCCYFTKHLMQLKIHLGSFHKDQLTVVKTRPSIVSEDFMKLKVLFDPFSAQKICLVTITNAVFVIYIIRGDWSSKLSYNLNVLTISDTTSIYKFTCNNSSKFSMFYKGQPKAQEGIEIDPNTLETVRKKNCVVPNYLINLHIKKVASLHD